jgi:hypothetical protein
VHSESLRILFIENIDKFLTLAECAVIDL